MALIPIVQNLHDEFVLYVAMIDNERTMDELCEDVSKISIGFEHNRREGKQLRVRKLGEAAPYPRDITAIEADIAPMMSLEFYYEKE